MPGPTISKQHMLRTHERFQEALNEQKIQISKLGSNVVKAIARKTLGRLVSRSPIDTGRYVSSHKVSIGGMVSSEKETDERFDAPQKNRRSATGFAIANGQRVIAKAKNPKKITINNTAEYAISVEVGIGWKMTPGYFVYHHTLADMMEEAPAIIKAEEAKIK